MRRGALWLCGVGDEAGRTIEQQIDAQGVLGWRQLELRTVDDVLVQDLPVHELERIGRALHAAAIDVPVICSSVGNWANPVDGPLARDLRQLDGALQAARILGARLIRVMSFPAAGQPAARWRAAVLERIATLATRAEAADVMLAVENCAGWAATDAERAAELVAAVPGVGILFDCGNPVAYGYDGLRYLRALLPSVVHVHVKDARAGASERETEWVAAGSGDGRLAEILALLVQSGYAGGLSIEPEVRRVFHRGVTPADDILCASYLEYARDFERLLERALPGAAVADGALRLPEAVA